MSYINDHHRRWKPHFGGEPWWEMYCALYEGPGHDWEGADIALDQMIYALAKAKGIDTTQVCPSCSKWVDQARSLREPSKHEASLDEGCEACRAEDEPTAS